MLMSSPRRWTALLTALAALIAAPPLAAQTVDEVVARHIEARGGHEPTEGAADHQDHAHRRDAVQQRARHHLSQASAAVPRRAGTDGRWRTTRPARHQRGCGVGHGTGQDRYPIRGGGRRNPGARRGLRRTSWSTGKKRGMPSPSTARSRCRGERLTSCA